MKDNLTDLLIRNSNLEYIVRQTLWMARRYADGRRTYAATDFNEAVDLLLKMGIPVEGDGVTNKIYADDGQFGEWVPKAGKFIKEIIK